MLFRSVATGNPSCEDSPASSSYSVSTIVSDVPGTSSGGCYGTTTAMDATITVPSGAKVLAIWTLGGSATGASVAVTPQLDRDGAEVTTRCSFYLPATANENRSCTDFHIFTGLTAGFHTFKLRANSNVSATFTAFRRLMVVVLP